MDLKKYFFLVKNRAFKMKREFSSIFSRTDSKSSEEKVSELRQNRTSDVSGEVSLDEVEADEADGAGGDAVQQSAASALKLSTLGRTLPKKTTMLTKTSSVNLTLAALSSKL